MPTFFKDELNADIIQFTPRPTPVTGRSNSPSTGGMWYDSTIGSFQGIINGVATPIGGLLASSPIPAASAQGPTYNVVNYGAKGDAKHIRDGVTAGAAKTISSATAHFQTTATVGQFITCVMGGTTLMPVGSRIVTINSDTLITTDTNDSGAGSSGQCVWYTQDDTAKFLAAYTAAKSALASVDPNVGFTLGNNNSVYCPEGGYAVSGKIYGSIGTGSSIIPNFIGAGKQQCLIYVLPTTVDPGTGDAILMSPALAIGTTVKGFSVDGLGKAFNFSHPIIWMQGMNQFTFDDVKITNINAGGSTNGTLDFLNSANGVSRNVFVQTNAAVQLWIVQYLLVDTRTSSEDGLA